MDGDALARKLSMDHLSEQPLSVLRGETEKATAEAVLPSDDPGRPDPRDKEVYTFNFDWSAPGKPGATYSGRFVSRILDEGKKLARSALRVRLSGGVAFDALDPLTRDVTHALAHMEFALDADPRPDWAKDLLRIKDRRLLLALYTEVALHEAIFLGLPTGEGAGAAGARAQ